MQAIYKTENVERYSRRTNSVDIVIYIQGGSVDVWKENILEDLEAGLLEYKIVKEFLVEIKKKFGGEDEETVKVVELKRLEQGGKTMEKFI